MTFKSSTIGTLFFVKTTNLYLRLAVLNTTILLHFFLSQAVAHFDMLCALSQWNHDSKIVLCNNLESIIFKISPTAPTTVVLLKIFTQALFATVDLAKIKIIPQLQKTSAAL